MYVAIVSSGCCKIRLGVAHVAMCVRKGGAMSGPRVLSGGTGESGRARAPRGHVKRRHERGRGVQARTREIECNAGVRTWVSIRTSVH
jgi:hypothetical protein